MTEPTTNAYEFTVSELANSLKRTVEETYGHVRVRGELGRVTVAKSGHCYLDVKDDRAVINSIIWKGVMGRLSMRPEEGMEVIIEGKLSTYPGRSNYQLIIDKMELAGAGALMALFEKRKKILSAEGLFAQERKRDLPFLPQMIGVITSPTGSVIRDILHRIEDRFPSHVLVWPVLVQGDKAAEQVAAAITGFNHASGFARPDVLIVARGGGSMEDLWCFNEENVARAAANSDIPLISAIGHETDWTLLDYVADYRAPTPTGAAEVAVPVLADYLLTVEDYALRLTRGLRRSVTEKSTKLSAARLPKAEGLLSASQQRLDLAIARLPKPERLLEPLRQKLAMLRLPNLTQLSATSAQHLSLAARRLRPALDMTLRRQNTRLADIARRLKPDTVSRLTATQTDRLNTLSRAASRALSADLKMKHSRLLRASKLLEAYSYQGVLNRGYTLVTDAHGQVISRQKSVSAGQAVTLTFSDGQRNAVIEGKAPKRPKPKPKATSQNKIQPDLF